MSRPSLLTYLIGNVASLVAVFGLMVWSIHAAFVGQVEWWVALVAIIATGMSVNAGNRITEYQNWKHDWDAMSGAPPKRSPRIPGLKQIVGVAILCVGAWGAVTYGGQPGMEIPVALFWVGGAFAVGRGLYVLAQRGRSKAKAAASRDVAVAVLLPIPRQSPDAVGSITQLPGYCGALMPGGPQHL